MAVSVKHINGDTTFLLTFSSDESTLTPYQQSLSNLTVLVDPWIEGPYTILHRKITYVKRKSSATIRNLLDLQPRPHIILISQDKPDHCNERTLKQLPPDLTGTVIIAPASAAKRIKSWNYFDERKVWTFSNYAPDRPSTVFDLRLPLESDARTVIHPGQLTLAFMPAKFDVIGLHQAIGITYRAPLFTNSDEGRTAFGVSLHSCPTHSSTDLRSPHVPPVPALPPTPPDSPGRISRVVKERHRPPRLALNEPSRINLGESIPSPPLTAYQPPPIPDTEEHHGLRGRAISSSSMRGLYNKASRIVTKSTPNLRESGGRRLQRKHRRTTSTQTPKRDNGFSEATSPDKSPSSQADKSDLLSPASPKAFSLSPFSTRFSTGRRTPLTPNNNMLLMSPPLSISSPLPRPSTATSEPLKPGRTLSVLYSPHGVAYSTIKPWAETHLVPLSALPLTLLLHPLTHVQNWWLLGGNIMTGWRGGAEIARSLMAKCWMAAHDGPKDESGLLVKTIKKGQWNLEGVRRAVRAFEGGTDETEEKEKKDLHTEILQLSAGGEKLLI